MNSWETASRWEGDGIRREVFLFPSGKERLYGSLYAATEPTVDIRLVVCSGWGHELLQLNELGHAIALGVARLGGAGILFHPTGHGDSSGSISDLTVAGNVASALDAMAEGARRMEGGTWAFAGVRTGGAVAVLAARAAGARVLALVDPALDPAGHFQMLRRRATRMSLGRNPTTLFGHPLPEPGAEDLDAPSPLEVLAQFEGRAAVIRFAHSQVDPVPGPVEDVVVPGRFSIPPGPNEQRVLASAAVRWIKSSFMASVV